MTFGVFAQIVGGCDEQKRNILEIKSTFENSLTKLPCRKYNCICAILTGNRLKCRGEHMRHFLITYKENRRNGLGMIMHRKISISKPTGDIGLDAKAAVGIFISSTGNLKKNEIIEIQEVDENNEPIGEVIKPMDNTSIVPTGR